MSQPNEDNNTHPNDLLKLRAALNKSFQDIAKCVSEEEFLEISTYLKSKSSSAVKRIHKAMEAKLAESFNGVLQEVVTEECIVSGLQILSKLKEESTVSPDAKLWRPPGDVHLHLRTHDAEKMLKECEDLENYINKKEKENEELKTILSKRRDDIQSLNDNMKQLINYPFKLSELENTVKFNQECVEKLYDPVS